MKIRILLLIPFLAIAFVSCEKDGLGARGEIRGSATYDGKTVKNSLFYIKYGASRSPGTDIKKYDASTSANADGIFRFTGLNPGDYYIYAVADDMGSPKSGGQHITLAKSELKDNVIIEVKE